jgi:hypothetical protein
MDLSACQQSQNNGNKNPRLPSAVQSWVAKIDYTPP